MEAIYQERIRDVQKALRNDDVDYLLVTLSPDLFYLTGYSAYPSERLRLLIVPLRGKPSFVFPDYEREAIDHLAPWIDVCGWRETDRLFSLVADMLSRDRTRPLRIAVGDLAPALFLLHMQAALPQARFVPASEILAPMRRTKDEHEIDVLEKGQELAVLSLKQLFDTPFAGRSERELAAELARICEQAGLGPGVTQVGSGPNGAKFLDPTDRVIQRGEAVVIDFCTTYRGYWTDCTRTAHVGPPSDEFQEIYEIVREANHAAFAAVRPSVRCEDVDRAARQVIRAAGYGEYFVHRAGHGIGIEMHEEPWVVEGNPQPLEPGMVLTIEPGIYLPDKFGYRLEDVVLVEERGGRSLTHYTHDLIIVE